MEFFTGKRLSSPFSKGEPRGILLRGRFPEDHRSVLSVQAKLNYTTSTSGGFCKYYAFLHFAFGQMAKFVPANPIPRLTVRTGPLTMVLTCRAHTDQIIISYLY